MRGWGSRWRRGQAACLLAAAFLAGSLISPDRAGAASDTADPQPPEAPSTRPRPTIDGEPLQNILNSKAYIDELVRYLIGYETWIYICADARPQERVRTMVISDPVELPGVDLDETPQWLEVVRVHGCNRDYERMIYASYRDGKPVFHAKVAGDTRTTPRVQHEAVTALRDAASAFAVTQGCPRSHRARVVSARSDTAWPETSDTRWREIWVVSTCKGTRDVPVTFSDDGASGVTFSYVIE